MLITVSTTGSKTFTTWIETEEDDSPAGIVQRRYDPYTPEE